MIQRAIKLLARLRPQQRLRPVLPAAPPRCWTDELQDAGLTASEWLAVRRAVPRLYVGLSVALVQRMHTEYAALVGNTVAAAERILRHEFDLLGSGSFVSADPARSRNASGYQPIDWYLDPIRGLRFPAGVPIADFSIETMRPGLADIKLPWELGRCQHWPTLGQAYRLTGDPRFAREIADELIDFVEANPVGTAVQWSCTMDVALRAANWALALELIADAPLDADFWTAAYGALFDHGVFIAGHLENTYEVTSNHFLSDIVGLFYVATVFRDLQTGAGWSAQCRRWLCQELDVQVLADGADYESSVPYHRLVTELFMGAARLADHAGTPFPDPFLDRIRSMVEFLAAVLRPDGLMPQVGDADDGRLQILSAYGTWNPQGASYLFGPAACMFDRSDWMALAGSWGEWESFWWGLDPSEVSRSLPVHPPAAMRHFPHAGLTVIRRDRDYLLVTNGVVGTAGFGNHKHNDLLGFEYHVNGVPVFVDAGSYVYTSDPVARNLFRSTAYHNTVTVDEAEQNEFKSEWLFRMFEKATPEHVVVESHDDLFEYRGRHRGYTRLPHPIVHERAIAWPRSQGTLEIVDTFEGTGAHRLHWHFHLAPGVDVRSVAAGQLDIQSAAASLRLHHDPALSRAVVDAWYSPSYGVRQRCLAVELETTLDISDRQAYSFGIVTG